MVAVEEGGRKPKKSTKIDMTAMDVAFLLLTFFVLTATMSSSSVMELTIH
ncbi:MAG: biopolymer transporter ExbD [Bacteroidia bacterium]